MFARARCWSVFVSLLAAAGAQAPAKRPNVLMVFTDDHAAHAISAYGSRINRTPQLDRLAQAGMRFDNAFVTNSICAPSRAVLLTGKHSHRNGQLSNEERFDGSQPTFPKLFQAAGYTTAMLGKWHLQSDPTGFDHWRVLVGQGTYYNPRFLHPDGSEVLRGYTTDLITDMAIGWLEQRDRDKPFLLFVQHKAPHREWTPAARHVDLYADVTIPEPDTLFDAGTSRAPGFATQTMSVARDLSDLDLKRELPRNLDEAQRAVLANAYAAQNAAGEQLRGEARTRFLYQRYIKDYLRCVAAVDEGVGRLLDWLDRNGLADDTIVIYASDQGFFLGDHGFYDKRFMYEEALRFPLLWRWPGQVAPGSVNADLVQNLDLAPTLLDACGIAVPSDMQGKSLVPLLRGRTPSDWRTAAYYHYYEFPGVHDVPRHCGVRTKTHKLIHYYQLDAWELFDLVRDPREQNNVFADSAYAEVRASLQAELLAQQRACGDTDPHRRLDNLERAARAAKAAQVPRTEVLVMRQLGDPLLARPEPKDKPLTFGARCARDGDGVVLAQGGERFGYALWLAGGRPCVGVREAGALHVVRGPALPSGTGQVTLAGVLTASGELQLWVDGKLAERAAASLLSRNPSEALSLGADSGTAVGDYRGEQAFRGEIADLRIYYGALPAKELAAWAGR